MPLPSDEQEAIQNLRDSNHPDDVEVRETYGATGDDVQPTIVEEVVTSDPVEVTTSTPALVVFKLPASEALEDGLQTWVLLPEMASPTDPGIGYTVEVGTVREFDAAHGIDESGQRIVGGITAFATEHTGHAESTDLAFGPVVLPATDVLRGVVERGDEPIAVRVTRQFLDPAAPDPGPYPIGRVTIGLVRA